MKFNHYYAELGLKPTDFPFEGEEDILNRNEEDEEGFSGTEFFSLDYSLALYIYGRLCYFRDHCLVGNPVSMSFEQWSDIIDKMIKGFELYVKRDESTLSKNQIKQMNYGMRLFIKYFHDLWY